MNRYVTVGLAALAGAALFEAALIPGIVIGGAAMLAPKYLPRLRQRRSPAAGSSARRATTPKAPQPDRRKLGKVELLLGSQTGLGLKQALFKTVTFRVIVTTLDFTTNVVVIGELATAAGLSTFSLVVGPIFYFAHETVWNYYLGPAETSVALPAPRPAAEPGGTPGGEGFTISRALAKTITFRTIATVMDFTTNYVVVGDIATAAGLSAFGFVVGPFVYFGHERIWDYYSSTNRRAPAPPRPAGLLPVSGAPQAGAG
jgi:uncharacterized membrane protein